MAELQKKFPEGVEFQIAYDPTVFEAADAPERAGAVSVVPSYGTPDALLLDLPIAIATAAAHADYFDAGKCFWL